MNVLFAAIVAGLVLAPLGASARAPKAGKWQTLFDGSSTDAWRGYKQSAFPTEGWTVEEGALKAVKGGHGDIVTKEKYRDFELELEWRVSPGANSGIFYHATEEFDAIYQSAPEMQILDNDTHPDGKEPKTSAGSLYALIAPSAGALKPVGDWNRVRIVAKGSHVEHWLNGKKVVDFELGSDALNSLIKSSKFASWPGFAKSAEGYIGLQNHGDDVWFRNVRIRRLDT